MRTRLTALVTVIGLIGTCGLSAAEKRPDSVSYYRDIRAIFQSHCHGCHQPAKSGGEYVMTDFTHLLAGGESAEPAVVPGKPTESYLIDLVTPVDGESEMPKGKPPLSQSEIDLLQKWIAGGAQDDTPENAKERFDMDHPPVYSRQPIVTSIDFSPDGSLLAISGFHEVLLHHADGSGLAARLVGLSERIESLAFSPDGMRLAVTGGLPERTGELQIWDVASKKLRLSIPLTYDTVYGASWSPDSTLVAVGCTDSIVRGFNAETGEQIFFNGAHDDWALDTVFSLDGSHLISVGRDMTTKLYNVPTQRFIDNVTSITPGALKGGIATIARHPARDEVLVGGSDGTPRIYRMHRQTKRVIGDDANLLRRFPPMRGRIHAVDFSPDGKLIACGSSLDGRGQVFTYSSEYDSTLSDELKEILQKLPQRWKPEEAKIVETFVATGADVVTQTEISAGIYALNFSPDGSTVAAAGADGTIRFISPQDGSVIRELQPVSVDSESARATAVADRETNEELDALSANEILPEGRTLTGIEVSPPIVRLNGSDEYRQLLVTGLLDSGDRVDVTRMARFLLPADVGQVTPTGQLAVKQDGLAAVVVQMQDHAVGVPVVAEGVEEKRPISYVHDVMPVISRLGCNAGTCHGSKDGKEGFKLSLRGYDPIYDVRAWTDDLKARRINLASPDDSLLLLKATGAVPHVGGQPTLPGSKYYQVLRRWIAEGAQLDFEAPRVATITIEPETPVVQDIGARQQMRITAVYTDGASRDVTAEAFISSGNTDVAAVNSDGVVTTLRRGEAAVLARFEGAYAATTVTAMGDRTGFEWEEPETWGSVDELVAAKWKRMKIRPSELCNDADFIRRVSLDLTGLPPSHEQVTSFLADDRDTRLKRTELADQLIGSEEYVTYWTNKWADLLQVNSKFVGKEGVQEFRSWIRTHIDNNTPYDKFCHEILTAAGSNKNNPAASYYKILRKPDVMMENTTHLFLAVRFNCNKCHDHPFERWTQDQYYQTAAFFARVGLKKDEASGKQKIGGTAVEGAKPLYEVVFDRDEGEITHERTGAVTAPVFPYDVDFDVSNEQATRRDQLAGWITAPDNEYFVESYVNRIWGYLLGTGLIEPLDDIRAGNPPANPELLGYLANRFVESGFDIRDLIREIVNSRTYQLSIATNKWNADDSLNFSHAKARRLPAEVLYDTIHTVTGAKMNIPGVPEGTRAAALADAATELSDGFLANLGRPARESACECERSSELQLGPVMALMNGETISRAISDPENEIANLVATNQNNQDTINQIFLRVLNRPARPNEIEAAMEVAVGAGPQHEALAAELRTYRAKIAPKTERRAKARLEAIEAAKKDLESYKAQIAEKEAELDRKQAEQSERLTAQLAEFDENNLQNALSDWQDEYERTVTWVTLEPENLNTNTVTQLTKLPDNSVLASRAGTSFSFYTMTAGVNLRRITAIRLEVLTHETLPKFGPGLADNGNFVLTEFTVKVAPGSAPESTTPIHFGSAQATFAQGGEFVIEDAINEDRDQSKDGWAIANGTGKDQAAIFILKEPAELTEPSRLSFRLEQLFAERTHTLGRFRISVTDSPNPVLGGVPKDIDDIVSLVDGARTDEQKERLLTWFNSRYEERRPLELALNKIKLPRAEDPEITIRRKQLVIESQPLANDPRLERLERAVKLSKEQFGNIRLTMAQDLVWALINSPAFLFNR